MRTIESMPKEPKSVLQKSESAFPTTRTESRSTKKPAATPNQNESAKKWIGLTIVLAFVLIGIFGSGVDRLNAITRLSDHSSDRLSNLVTLILGYYFGTQAAGK